MQLCQLASAALFLLSSCSPSQTRAFVSTTPPSSIPLTARRNVVAGTWRPRSLLFSGEENANVGESNDNMDNEASRLQRKAQELRDQIRKMEEQLGERRPRNYDMPSRPFLATDESPELADGPPSLKNKRILVAGANGRLGSMVCRYLLRNFPQTQVVAAVHVVGENSPTARGYGRLSYEVGAEDGIGSIGAAWSAEDRTATFEFDSELMKDYNLQNLRIVECEFLDPIQCMSVVEDSQRIDAIIWCATDFNGNQPRAVSGLNVAFLFRAVTRPDKGRVEIEGLQNLLGAFKRLKTENRQRGAIGTSKNQPTNVVLISAAPDAFEDFETPFGSFNGIKRQAEKMLQDEFPSLTSTVLQMYRYDETFVAEGLEAIVKEINEDVQDVKQKVRRRINRRDAAKAAVEALLNPDLVGKTVQVWTTPQS